MVADRRALAAGGTGRLAVVYDQGRLSPGECVRGHHAPLGVAARDDSRGACPTCDRALAIQRWIILNCMLVGEPVEASGRLSAAKVEVEGLNVAAGPVVRISAWHDDGVSWTASGAGRAPTRRRQRSCRPWSRFWSQFHPVHRLPGVATVPADQAERAHGRPGTPDRRPEKRKVGGSTPPLATPPDPHSCRSGHFCAILPASVRCPLMTAADPVSTAPCRTNVARRSWSPRVLPSRASCWVVIFSRRGFIPAGPVRAQGTLSALRPGARSGCPWARREEVAAPGALPLIFERCRVRAEPDLRPTGSAWRRIHSPPMNPPFDLRFRAYGPVCVRA